MSPEDRAIWRKALDCDPLEQNLKAVVDLSDARAESAWDAKSAKQILHWLAQGERKMLATVREDLQADVDAIVVRMFPQPWGADTPWPLREVVKKLVEATEHLKHGHNCDTHGHELYDDALTAARRWLEETGAR